MDFGNKSQIFSNIFKTPVLRNILAASLIIAVILPFYNIYSIIPSFNEQLTANTEDEALRTASYLRDLIIKENAELTKASLSHESVGEIKKLIKHFRLEKLKIFSKEGEILFSTTPEDIGASNRNAYFHNVVAKGKVYTLVVQKNTKSLEGQIMTADVVETYIPLLSNGVFLGALEIYYDITDRREKQRNLLASIYTVLFTIVLIFLITIFSIIFRLSKNNLDRDRIEEARREREEKHRSFLEDLPVGLYRNTPGPQGRFIMVNTALARLHGFESIDEFHNQKVLDLYVDPAQRKEISAELVEKGFVSNKEVMLKRKDGAAIWGSITARAIRDRSGEVIYFDGTVVDITDRKRMEAEILAMSINDQLTGLNNRRGFLSLAGQQLKFAARNKSGLLLFFADLDGLKWINDTLGHEEGDTALIEVATILRETFARTSDIIARLGGDEYAVLTIDTIAANSEIFTTRLLSLIDTRNAQENRKYQISISVGCSYYDPENPCSLNDLLANADQLMYEQKQKKKGLHLQTAPLSNSSYPYASMHNTGKNR